MTVDLTHPAVAQYLARLSDAARVLPGGRAEDLHGEIRDHLAQALAEAGTADGAAVLQVLERLGPPEDIVAAELENQPGYPVAGLRPDPISASLRPDPIAASLRPAPIGPVLMPDPRGQGAAHRGPWGPVEVIAVLLLTVGVVTVIGPVVGLALAWLSQRWSLREKLIATVAALASVVVVVGLAVVGLGLFAGSSSSVVQVQELAPVPAPPGSTLPGSTLPGSTLPGSTLP